ncbi:hypothetical protein AVEN_56398-1 [Araneus ventricosus]|uniref:Uncharacterized protein n=1 Tax=Araneus ventricosus TaxID=182803 RepID=A0A4Y2WKW5_ARAVE|nr:hypothetical protein AVEN_56398-1 [Araneus ventricosus]
MLRYGVILLPDNTHTARKTQELLRKFKSGATPLQPRFGTQSGTRFSSDIDVKTTAENWLKGQGRNFYRDGLNKFVLCSDKCLNRFGDYVEK